MKRKSNRKSEIIGSEAMYAGLMLAGFGLTLYFISLLFFGLLWMDIQKELFFSGAPLLFWLLFWLGYKVKKINIQLSKIEEIITKEEKQS